MQLRVLAFLVTSAAATAAAAPMRVAVMDFTDAAPQGSLSHLGSGLQSMITTDLAAATSSFDIVERARLRDIQAELKLQRRAEIDPRTAVKIGKLAGASHLVSGSFTVLDDKMRIDCRLVAVDSGKVLLAEKVEGDKSAFFELEKTLVQKVVGSLGAKVEPKERAAMAKVHTADFEAFRKFSEGIVQFDEQKYDEALRSMRDATQLDAEFKLAQVTLAGYEELVSKARASVTAARQTEDELARLKLDKETKTGADIVARLYDLSKKGGKRERLIAVLLLALTYDSVGGMHGPLQILRKRGDAFAQQRMSDNFYKAYWAGVGEVFPAAPPVPEYVRPPDNLDKVDAEFSRAVADAAKNTPGQTLGINFLYNGLNFAKKLQLDRRQAVQLLERVYQLALKLDPPLEWKLKRQIELAEQWQQLLELDRSTAYLVQAQKGAKDSQVLKRVADLLEQNRELTRTLQEGPAPRKDELREFLRTASNHDGLHNVKEARKKFVGNDLTYHMAEPIVRHRGWPRYDDEYVLIGNEPVWAIEGNNSLSTGPRSDRMHAAEIRYLLRYSRKGEGNAILVAGAQPGDRVRLSFKVPFEAPLDVQLAEKSDLEAVAKLPAEQRRPMVSALFGVRNIEHETQPLEAYAVRFAPAAVRLVKVTGEKPKGRALREQAVAEWPADLAGAKSLSVAVKLDGKTVAVEVNGKKFSAKQPADAGGFVGLAFDGTGYAAAADLLISR